MKIETSMKKIKENYTTIGIGYCNAYHLLSGIEPTFYNCGVYGWNNDIYIIGDVAIVTGYRNLQGDFYPNHETLTKYEKKAKQLYKNYDLSKHNYKYDLLYKKIEKLRNDFIKEVLEK